MSVDSMLNKLLGDGPNLLTVTCHCGRAMELRSTSYGRMWSCTGYPVCQGRHGAHLKAEVGKAHIAEMTVDECDCVVRACLRRKFQGKKNR